MKTLIKLLGILLRRKSMPPINQEAVDIFLATLNKGNPDSPLWIELDGTHSIMEMALGANNVVTFNMNRGYPLKAFKNLTTQEVKIYDARRFSAPA